MAEPQSDRSNALLVYVHVPKAGGMSVTRVLQEIYGDRLLVAHPLRGWPQEWPEDTVKLIESKRDYFQAFAGHYAYGIHELFDRPARYFTTVRDPLPRMESYYNFVSRWDIHHHHAKANELGIVGFFQWMLDNDDIEFGNLQCLLIAGVKSFAAARARIDESFEFAVPTERLDEALRVLAKRFNWPRVPEPPKENTTPHLSKLTALPDGLVQSLLDANAEDKALHEYCKQRWDELYSATEICRDGAA